MKLWPLSSSKRCRIRTSRHTHTYVERDEKQQGAVGPGDLTSRRCSFAVDVIVDGICMPGWPFNVSVSVSLSWRCRGVVVAL